MNEMNEATRSATEFRDGTVELLDCWRRRTTTRVRSPEPPAPTVDELTHYFAGALTADEEHRVLRAAVRQPVTRAHLRSVRDSVRDLQQMSWAEVHAHARSKSPAAPLAQSWLTIITQALCRPVPGVAWKHGQQLTREVANTLRVVGRQLQAALALPRLALARGQADGPTLSGATPSFTLDFVDATINADGALHVDLRAANGATIEGCPVHVGLTLGGEVYHLLSGLFHQGRASWRAPALGEALGLRSGQLPRSWLHITFGPLTPETRVGPLPVITEVFDSNDRATSSVVLELMQPPRWEHGKFLVTLGMSDEVRQAYSDHQLQLGLILAAHCAQRLGEWRVRDWAGRERMLTVDCPGAPDLYLPMTSFLRAVLRPLAA